MFELISTKTYKILFIIAVIMTLVMTLSATPNTEIVRLISDKFAHWLIFFFLSFLCSHAIGRNFGLTALIGLALFGYLIEVIQYYLPWRTFSWLDWFADIAGILSYDLIHRVKRYYLKKQQKLEGSADV